MPERDTASGGARTAQRTGSALQNSTPETCVFLFTSVTPIHSTKKKFCLLFCMASFVQCFGFETHACFAV